MSDAAVIARFQKEMALESEGALLDEAILIKGVTAALSDPSKGTYYVVRTEGGDAAGSLLLTKEWSDWNNCWHWWIQSVYVMPEYRRQGAFASLFNKVRALAAEEGAYSLRLYVDRNNAGAKTCYGRLGMEESHYLMYEC